MEFSAYDRPYQEFSLWEGFCPPGEWCRLPASAFSGIFADDLLAKTNGVLLLSSDAGDVVTYVADILRIDVPASAIDQEPFILGFDHSVSSAFGYFIHHGGWDGRSINPGSTFFDAVEASGIDHYYPYSFIPPGKSGPMSDIRAHPEADLFWQEMKRVRQKFPNPGR